MRTWFKIISILLFVSFLTTDLAFAQKIPVKIDSTKIYKSIESFSLQRKFTQYMYGIFFKPLDTPKKKAYKKLIQKPYSAFEGKIIRKINIETLDPFGFSIADTIEKKQGAFAKNANKLHIKTQKITIRNLLLIHRNQVFDSLLVKESERLVRSMSFITDVSFFVIATAKNSDSVDIYIRELDKWSIIPNGAISANSFTINLKDNNFMGLGHESKNEYTWNNAAENYAYQLNYFIPNIQNTYINSTFQIGKEESGNFKQSIGFDRPFFSPFAKWAAGVNFSKQFRHDFIRANDSILVLQPFKFNVQDYWAGNAIQIFKGNTEFDRATNLFAAVRYLHVKYLEKPDEVYDMQHYFSNENFYLASIGISTRKYVQDKYIFKFGVTEDVPVGKVYSVTAGFQKKTSSVRNYLGARISSGNYYQWGYLSYNAEYGTFFHGSSFEQGVFTAGVNYFTGLKEIGKWKFRQFIKPQVTIGFNRFVFDSLTLNEGYGMNGFNSPSLAGTSRILFTLQTQSYAPWNFIGFRFGPFLSFSLGKLSDKATSFINSKTYSEIGVGVMIKNDHLVMNSFQISFAFYPVIPGKGQNIFKVNSFRTTDFGFRDFESGKPAVVVFH